jgi:hypothetical protein
MLGQLADIALAGPDMSGIDAAVGVWKLYQTGQNAVLLGGVVHAGLTFGKRGAITIMDELEALSREKHHGIPAFMGGNVSGQIMYNVPTHLHARRGQFHSIVNARLQANGCPAMNKGFEDYLALSGRQKEAFTIYREVCAEFDARHSTSFGVAFDVNYPLNNFQAIGAGW